MSTQISTDTGRTREAAATGQQSRSTVKSCESGMEPRETMRTLPGVVQPFLTWVTGAPLAGEEPLVRWTPLKAGALGVVCIVFGVALGAQALARLSASSIPLLLLSWLTTAGGMRRLDVVIVHQALHNRLGRSPRMNRIVAELITTLLWRVPYDENRKEHLIHHTSPCSMRDIDTRYLLSTGFRPGLTRAEYRSYLLEALVSPRHHLGLFAIRIRSNFSLKHPPYRVAMSCLYLAATISLIAATGLWVEWLVLWLVPATVFFQIATFLYTHTEHRWWIFQNREGLTKAERDLLTFARLCGDPVPDLPGAPLRLRVSAWARWWLRIFFVHAPYRMFVLVGDTVQHDLHHVRPTVDWANSAHERSRDLARGSKRYTQVWGSLLDHLHAAGDVRGLE
jgi:fatty acid desaturase